MSDTIPQFLSPLDAEQETLLNLFFEEVNALHEQMQRDQSDIDRLKAETRLIAAHTDQLLLEIEAQLDALQKAA